MLEDYASLRAKNENLEALNKNLPEKINDQNSTRKEKYIKNNVHLALEENIKGLNDHL